MRVWRRRAAPGRRAPAAEPQSFRVTIQAAILAAHAVGCVALRLEQPTDGGGPQASQPEVVSATRRCEYGTFGEGFLTGLQRIPDQLPHQPFESFDHGSSVNKEGLFVYPEAKLAMCIIEKTGCSSWSTVFNKLARKMPAINAPWYGLVDYHWSPKRAATVFSQPDSTRIVWVREPLERFLSGFLSKCASWSDRYDMLPSICPFKYIGQAPGFPLSQAKEWFDLMRQNGRLERSVRKLDSHFTAQAAHCELRHRLREYSVIGLMTKGGFARDAACLLERANLSHVNTRGPPGTMFFEQKEDVELTNRRSVEVLKRFFTPDFARMLADIFAEDYEVFRIQRPAWIEEATGEWFDLRPQDAVNATGKALGDLELSQQDDDEDDLVLLAERAGYSLADLSRGG